MQPYKDLEKSQEILIREFSDDIDPIDLKWHRDLMNREIYSPSDTDWLIQLENQLPIRITKNFIPALEWHRVIKGSGKLTLHIREW